MNKSPPHKSVLTWIRNLDVFNSPSGLRTILRLSEMFALCFSVIVVLVVNEDRPVLPFRHQDSVVGSASSSLHDPPSVFLMFGSNRASIHRCFGLHAGCNSISRR